MNSRHCKAINCYENVTLNKSLHWIQLTRINFSKGAFFFERPLFRGGTLFFAYRLLKMNPKSALKFCRVSVTSRNRTYLFRPHWMLLVLGLRLYIKSGWMSFKSPSKDDQGFANLGARFYSVHISFSITLLRKILPKVIKNYWPRLMVADLKSLTLKQNNLDKLHPILRASFVCLVAWHMIGKAYIFTIGHMLWSKQHPFFSVFSKISIFL